MSKLTSGHVSILYNKILVTVMHWPPANSFGTNPSTGISIVITRSTPISSFKQVETSTRLHQIPQLNSQNSGCLRVVLPLVLLQIHRSPLTMPCIWNGPQLTGVEIYRSTPALRFYTVREPCSCKPRSSRILVFQASDVLRPKYIQNNFLG